MAESRDTYTCPSDEEQQTMKNPDGGGEEKEDLISSDPSSVAADKELSVSESKSGNDDSIQEEAIGLNLIDRLPYNRSFSKKTGSLSSITTEPTKLLFLFEKTLHNPNSEVLNIPDDIALAHFPPIELVANQFGDAKNVSVRDFQRAGTWTAKFFYCPIHKSYAIGTAWKRFATFYKMEAGDVLHFHKKKLTSSFLYIVRVTKKYGYGLVCLFEKTLTHSDVSIESLQLPKLEGDKFFSDVKNGNGSSDKEEDVILVSDAQKGLWPMSIKFIPIDRYLISGGWSEFVSAHELKATDVIRFYKVVENEKNDRHYLIDYVRAKAEAETSERGGCSGDCYSQSCIQSLAMF